MLRARTIVMVSAGPKQPGAHLLVDWPWLHTSKPQSGVGTHRETRTEQKALDLDRDS
jgi:hypothetical protein